jgi:hypothetical protein
MSDDLAKAVKETADELLDWARSDANTGPYSQEAYRTYVHIAAALGKLASKLRGGDAG